MAQWIGRQFRVTATHLRDLAFRGSTDREAILAARTVRAVVMTKDEDFVRLVEELGSPPQIIWLTCGNTSNARLKELLASASAKAFELLEAGEPLVEIGAS